MMIPVNEMPVVIPVDLFTRVRAYEHFPQRILVTGGSGSLGSALITDFLQSFPTSTVLCLSRDVHRQDLLVERLKKKGIPTDNLRLMLGDVRDKNRLEWVMRGATTVLHCAAIKHVGAGEYSPNEYILTNIEGTRNVAETALRANVEKCLFISTDKSCQPANLYGRTKAVAERLWVRYNGFNRVAKLSCIRYGNVFDSRGGVYQVWKKCVENEQPLTVRIPDPTRFICFLSWGVQWVKQCLDMMRGGEIFVPANLSALSLHDLARELQPDDGLWVKERLKAGEKQHEILLAPEEHQSTVYRDGFWIVNPEDPQWPYEAWEGGQPDLPYSSDGVPRMNAKEFLRLYQEEAQEE